MTDKQLAPLVEEIAQALTEEVEPQTIETELNRYLNEYNVPLGEAKRIVIKKLGGDPRNIVTTGRNVTISEIRDGMFRLGTVAMVLSVEERTYNRNGEEQKFYSGLLADPTGKVQFTAWFDFELAKGDVIRISNAYTKSWRGMPQLNLSENTDVKKLQDGGDIGDIESLMQPKRYRIEEILARGGTQDALVEGVILEVKPRSGLIMRCSECNRVLQKGACVIHGKVDGTRDLRVKAVIDDGTGSATAVINRDITEKILGMNLDECTALAQERMDTEIIFDNLEEKLLAMPSRLRGNVLSDDYGLTVIVSTFEFAEAGDIGQFTARETAWRVFAGEFNNSSLKLESEDERAPRYVVTPLGARVNRLYIVGVLTEVENRGSDEEPFWRGRISDPTGVFFISAGQYRPSAAKVLRELQDRTPCYVAVSGKARTYEPEEGTFLVSVMPESVKEVDADLRAYWVLDTAKHMRKRINAISDALTMETPSADALVNLGYPGPLAEGVVSAIEHYGELDLEHYKAILVDALRSLLPEYSALQLSPKITPRPAPAAHVAGSTPAEGGGEDTCEPQDGAGEKELEDMVQKLIEELDVDDEGAPYKEVSAEAEKNKISREKLEEIVGSLLDQGLVYEPVLGRLKLI